MHVHPECGCLVGEEVFEVGERLVAVDDLVRACRGGPGWGR